jgi:hypothetical protein
MRTRGLRFRQLRCDLFMPTLWHAGALGGND